MTRDVKKVHVSKKLCSSTPGDVNRVYLHRPGATSDVIMGVYKPLVRKVKLSELDVIVR